jgi:Family of unknown function (DUF5706)
MSEPAKTPTGDMSTLAEGRNSIDMMLQTLQSHHVLLSLMADTKANIIITAASIVITIALTRVDQYRVVSLTLVVFCLAALFAAVFAVLPKYQNFEEIKGPLPPHFNLFFFAHFSTLSRERFMVEAEKVLGTEPGVYTAFLNDIYSLGSYLAHRKYRYLRISYICFLTGFALACVQAAWLLFTA